MNVPKTYQNFVLCELGNLGLLAVCGLDSEQPSEKEVVDLELSVNVGEMATETKDETNETIRTAERGVYACTDTWHMLVGPSTRRLEPHTNQTTRNSKL